MARWGTKTRRWEVWHKEQYPLTFSSWYNLGGRKYHPRYKHRELDPELVGCFKTFLAEVGERPSKDMTLDRIDNNKGYVKGNLRWADKRTQRLNQNQEVFLTGKRLRYEQREFRSVKQLADYLGRNDSNVWKSIKRGTLEVEWL